MTCFCSQMTAYDPDTGDNGQLRFSVLYRPDDARVFSVQTSTTDPKTALIYTTRTFNRLSTDIDSLWFNDTVKLKLTVKVSDNGLPHLSTNCFVLVTINDKNDNAPVFDYSNFTYTTYVLPTKTPPLTRIYRVFATDEDVGVNAVIIYNLTATSPTCSGCFYVEQSSGWILIGFIPSAGMTVRLLLYMTLFR